jgi:hypothetical protein
MHGNGRGKSLLFYGVTTVIVLACVYLSFELGRYEAGYSLLDERRSIMELEAGIAERDAAIDELRRQQAILETSLGIDRETYSAVEAQLAELQQRIQSQEEELAFYQGIVSPGDGVAGLRIQNVEIVTEGADHEQWLRLLLVQAIIHNDRVTGTVRVRIAGRMDNEEKVLGLGDVVADAETGDIPYGFRYFQSIERGLSLPEGFEPEELVVEIWPREPRGETVTQSYPWASITG